MFDTISNLRPYFHSLREIESNVSLDIKLPVKWRFEQIVAPYRTIKTKVQDKNDKFILLSIISHATSDGYDVVFTCAKDIIDTNIENEQKEKLLQMKIKELQDLFQKQSLDELKNLKFKEDEQQEDNERITMVGEGGEEGPEGDRDTQEEDD